MSLWQVIITIIIAAVTAFLTPWGKSLADGKTLAIQRRKEVLARCRQHLSWEHAHFGSFRALPEYPLVRPSFPSDVVEQIEQWGFTSQYRPHECEHDKQSRMLLDALAQTERRWRLI